MNENLVFLLNWVEVTIHPRQLIHSSIADPDFFLLKEQLAAELQLIKNRLFKNILLSKKQLKSILKRIVDISNIIYSYLNQLASAWNNSIMDSIIKSFYLYCLNGLEQAIEDFSMFALRASKQISITLYLRPKLVMEMKKYYKNFVVRLKKGDIDNDLKCVVQNGVYQLITKKGITYLNVEYCQNLMNTIIAEKDLSTEILTEILYLNGFNLPEFYLYCVTNLKNALADKSGLYEQLETVISEKDKLKGLPIVRKTKMLPEVDDLVSQLTQYLSEREHYILKMLKLQRVILQDADLSKPSNKVKINLSVAQFALFIRVQIEKGLLIKENIGDQFNFFATHFCTPQTTFISADSLRKKSTDVEFSTAQKLKANLIAMLNWLNENYNLSNYKES